MRTTTPLNRKRVNGLPKAARLQARATVATASGFGVLWELRHDREEAEPATSFGRIRRQTPCFAPFPTALLVARLRSQSLPSARVGQKARWFFRGCCFSGRAFPAEACGRSRDNSVGGNSHCSFRPLARPCSAAGLPLGCCRGAVVSDGQKARRARDSSACPVACRLPRGKNAHRDAKWQNLAI